MTTKEQERKALAQIKKIIADLGEDSYIAIAMEGMIEDAEENIENDFGCSWKNRAEVAEQRLSDLQTTYNKQITELTAKNGKLAYDLDFARIDSKEKIDNLTTLVKTRDSWVEQKNARIDELNKQLEDAAQKLCDQIDVIADKDRILAARDFEIMQLKAKLYDMMVKEVG